MLNVMFAHSKACNAPPLSIVLTRRLQHPKNCLAPSGQSCAPEKRPRQAHAAPSSVCGDRWRRADSVARDIYFTVVSVTACCLIPLVTNCNLLAFWYHQSVG